MHTRTYPSARAPCNPTPPSSYKNTQATSINTESWSRGAFDTAGRKLEKLKMNSFTQLTVGIRLKNWQDGTSVFILKYTQGNKDLPLG